MLTPVTLDPYNEVIDSVTSESTNAMGVGTAPSGAPPDNCSILYSPTAPCSSDCSSHASYLHSSPSPVSTTSPPSPCAEPPAPVVSSPQLTIQMPSLRHQRSTSTRTEGYSTTMHPTHHRLMSSRGISTVFQRRCYNPSESRYFTHPFCYLGRFRDLPHGVECGFECFRCLLRIPTRLFGPLFRRVRGRSQNGLKEDSLWTRLVGSLGNGFKGGL